jgi:uncharacterized protein (TIGR03435 family)
VYEVVSIKPSKGWHQQRILPNGLSGSAAPLSLIYDAYGPRKPGQIVGWPVWSEEAIYDIEARMDDETAAALQKFPPKEQSEQRRLMLRALLADRFKLKVHQETKILPLYQLVIAKGGPKLKESHASKTTTNGIGRLTAQRMTMASLTRILTVVMDRLVVDKTGLTGEYDFDLRWTPDDLQEGAGEIPQAVSGPSIFTALKEQLGLKAEPTKGPVDILVIDHIERPSEN